MLKASRTYQEELECAKKRLNELELLSKQRDETLEQYKIEIKNANLTTEKYNEERFVIEDNRVMSWCQYGRGECEKRVVHVKVRDFLVHGTFPLTAWYGADTFFSHSFHNSSQYHDKAFYLFFIIYSK